MRPQSPSEPEFKISSIQSYMESLDQLIKERALLVGNEKEPGFYPSGLEMSERDKKLQEIKNKVAENGQWRILDEEGNTALHLAVKEHNFVMVRVLLKLNLDTNIANSLGKTPASLAADQDDLLIEQFCRNVKDRENLLAQVIDEGCEIEVKTQDDQMQKRADLLRYWTDYLEKKKNAYQEAEKKFSQPTSSRTSDLLGYDSALT